MPMTQQLVGQPQALWSLCHSHPTMAGKRAAVSKEGSRDCRPPAAMGTREMVC
eukprot:CAMPEP_0114460982 /NCGR_PEP_ID=MMETSP0104-20121206/6035_1 /TAXON_ID=37642 ORGANISM="Paraphysomonas imperforata, Strain PA2" /NCGR_SAMPLE_ID=MMETSP0104 /ASSEMBLY_ACC=CAM_ASM_000202 /LENGTH=52 /DNA_ID=CAMNT_0001633729 /DNA_START=789 /DNA_END=947 /DNA_ORIENTATION=+